MLVSIRNILFHATFWVVVLILSVKFNGIAISGPDFERGSLIYLRASPTLIKYSVVSLAGAVLITWMVLWRKSLFGISGPLAIATAVAVPFLIAIMAVHPSAGSVVSRETLEGLRSVGGRNAFGFPIFFENNISAASEAELTRIREAFSIFRHCESGSVSVRGFASSAGFAGKTESQSNLLNLTLANNRASSVRDVLAGLSGQSPRVVVWSDFAEMLNERRVRDVSAEGERLVDAERLNRRVEIFWNDSACVAIQ